MTRAATYENVITWPLLDASRPTGRAADVLDALLDAHPELDGARVCAMPLHPSTGADIQLDIELERTMGPGVRRAETVRRVGADAEAEIFVYGGGNGTIHPFVPDDPDIVTTCARWITRSRVCVTLHTKVCACHPEATGDTR